MDIFYNIDTYKATKPTCLTIGIFDGVHLGHKKIISKLEEISSKEKIYSTVLTFDPHPRSVIHKKNIQNLTTIEEKIKIFETLNVDQLVIHPFDFQFSQYSVEDYVKKIIHEKFQAETIIIGYDHKFGKDRKGSIQDLMFFAKLYGFEVIEIDVQSVKNTFVSSSKIRAALQKGDVIEANKMLGYDYAISGMVVLGNGIGRTIGVPTANIALDSDQKSLPKDGVYIVYSYIDGIRYKGLLNIGNRPTVEDVKPLNKKSIEVNFLNFEGNLYQKFLSVNLVRRVRDEQKFDSLEALKTQIMEDQKLLRLS